MSDKSRLENNNDNLINITNSVSNLPPYVEIKNQDINITENGIYNADIGYTGLGEINVNVPVTSGVKLFDSIENMNNDSSPVEDGLAVVYRNSILNLTEETEFQVAIFPETVTLPSAYTVTRYPFYIIEAGSSSGYSMYQSSFTKTVFQLRYGSQYNIKYTSADGITYTRTSITAPTGMINGSTVNFGTAVEFKSYGSSTSYAWKDEIGYFIQIGSKEFNGLYQYTNNSYNFVKTQLTSTSEDVYNMSYYGADGINTGALQNVTNLTKEQILHRTKIYDDLSSLSFSNDVISISGMFFNCRNLITIPNINTTRITNMSQTFEQCTNLISIPNLDTSNVSDMYYVFYNCTNLSNISIFNTSNVTRMNSAFYNCTNLSNESYANIANSLPLASNIDIYFVKNIGLNGFNFTTNEQQDILENKGYIDVKLYPNEWSNYYNIYTNSGYVNIAKGEDYDRFGNLIKTNTTLETVNTINFIDNGPNGSLVSIREMFMYHYNLQTINLSQAKIENVIDMSCLFLGCNNLTSVENFNTTNVNDMGMIFYGCHNLTSIPNLDTSNVTNIGSMVANCYNLTSIPNFNTSHVNSMSNMFKSCNSLLNIPNFNTSNVTTMQYMFYDCTNLTTIPNFNTSKVDTMISMFAYCTNLTSVPNFDTSNVIHMRAMFQSCYNLISVPEFDTSNTTTMNYMFSNCYNLISVPEFDTSNIIDMTEMFRYCYNLVTVPEFDTSNIIDMSEMFKACNNLSNESIQNIVNMCINSNITGSTYKNLNNASIYSPLYNTKFDNSYYTNRWSDLTAAGWSY